MEWVLLLVADDAEDAESEVNLLRSRHILGRIVEDYGAYLVEVRAGELERARAVLRAKASVGGGRLPTQRQAWYHGLGRWGVRLLVALVLLIAVVPLVGFAWVVTRTLGGIAGATAVVVVLAAMAAWALMSQRLSGVRSQWGGRD